MQQFLQIIQSEISGSFAGAAWQVALVRLVAAAILGAIVGFEREVRGKAAGMRTHILVALAACLFTLTAQDLIALEAETAEDFRIDPLRLIEAITSGVAFLGAGTIIVARARVRGLTTAAGMWLAGAVGLCAGVGNLGLAAMTTALAVLILGPLRALEPTDSDK